MTAMTSHNNELDLFIEKKLAEEIDDIPVPQLDLQWKKFKDIYAQPDVRTPYRVKITWAAVILLAVTALFAYHPSNATAFGDRIINTLKSFVGKTSQNRTSTETRQGSVAVSPDIGNPGAFSGNNNYSTLEEAQKYVNFTIAKPSYLPDGAIIKNVNVTKLPANIYRLIITYDTNGRIFSLTERSNDPSNSNSIFYDTEDNSSTDITIDNKSGYQMKSKNGLTSIAWRTSGIVFNLSGDFPLEELKKTAGSVR